MSFGPRTALSLACLAACLLTVGFSAASFTDTTSNPQTIGAVADFVAPTVEASAIGKTQGGATGYVKAGGTYYVYARVADSGNPASGVASVKANVANVTSGQTAVTLVAGSYEAGGVSYGYRSAQLTASAGLSAGAKSYTVTATDAAGNSGALQGLSVAVENLSSLAGSQFATANGSGSSGKADKGDTVTFAFNHAPDPYSILAGWSGASAASVTVSIANNSSNDTLSVAGTALGSVALEGNYVSNTATFAGSTMSLSGSTVTIVLGSEPAGNARSETSKNEPIWTPSSSAFDLVGNACVTTKVTGANVRQF
jgi:hypothetical protein